MVTTSARLGYVIGLVAVAMAAAVRWLLEPVLGETTVYDPFLLAVVLVAWVAGFGPGLFTAVLGLFVAWYLFIGSTFAFDFTETGTPLRLALNGAVGMLIAYIGGLMHAARRDAQAQAQRVVATIESMSDAFMRLDDELRFVYVNAAVERSLGRSREDLLGRKLTDALPELENTTGHREYQRAIRENVSVEFEHYQPDWDRWFHAKADPAPDGGLTVYYQEITQRKRDEQALLRSEKRYRTLFESMDEGFCILQVLFDENGTAVDYLYIEANPAFEKQTGLYNVVGRTINELVTSGLERYWYETYGRVALTGEPEQFINHAEALGRWFEVDAFRIGEPEQRRVALLFTDITERKQAELDLRESEERLQLAQDAAGIGIHDFWIKTQEIEWDARVRQLWGLSDDEPVTFDLWRNGIHPEDRALAESAVASALDAEGDRQYFAEYRVINRKDGITRWVQVTGHPSFDDDGTAIRLVGTVQDITKRKAAEDALREANVRKDEFLATLAHELRNPLAAIRMAVSVVKHARDNQAQVSEMTDIIERQSAQLVRLIDDLLDVSRITRGKVDLHMKPLDFSSVVAHAVEGVRSTCDTRGLVLSVSLPEEPIVVNADGLRLAQVISNLLNNACKFTDRGDEVRVTADRQGDQAVVRVQDTGVGIPHDQLDRIFELFTQVDAGPRRSADGLGIGLSLAKSLTERHEGKIEAHSDGLGKGSEFIVRLPVAASSTEEVSSSLVESPEISEQPPRTSRPRRVLAVDDNHDALSAVERILQLDGHEVETADDGELALQLVRDHHPEAVLLDIGMPGLDGYEVARRIRSEPGGKDILLVAMTGWGQAKDKQLAFDAGFDEHLTKPADPDVLHDILTRRMNRVAVK